MTGKRTATATERRCRAKDELLVRLAAAAGEVSVAHARVVGLDPRGRANRAAKHEPAEAGRKALELLLEGRRHGVVVEFEVRWHARIDIERVPSLGSARVVVQ